jgi:hypothetical protein
MFRSPREPNKAILHKTKLATFATFNLYFNFYTTHALKNIYGM